MEDFVNEIVRALQGAFDDENGNSRFDFGDGNKVVADYVSP
jgi:anti-sigma factor ChrR (cupin superfamily)